MTTTVHVENTSAPNHHADHPGFGGVGGLVAALTFSVGRTSDAELAVHLANVAAGDDVIDIGCGPGVAARRAAAAGAASVVGVDPATVMLRVARFVSLASRHRSRVRYLEGGAEALPLATGSASVVWSLATVHHWRDIDLGLAEARRVLRPAGRLLAIERRIEPGAVGHASHGWTEPQARTFADRCRAAGFTSIAIEPHRTRSRAVLTVLARGPG